MDQNELKRKAAETALKYVTPHLDDNAVIGVGSGSTVNLFIDVLAQFKSRIAGAVAASSGSEARLKANGIPVLDLNSVDGIPVYVDGADEVTEHHTMIKGGGAALTREKIIGEAARQFICVVDASKLVPVLGKFPLPVEVIPMARSFIARKLVALGGKPVWREGVITDNGNVILDVHGLNIPEPAVLEGTINMMPGVVDNGLFARRPADRVILASPGGIREF